MNSQFPNKVFVTGIGTGIGKTVVSAVLTEALKGSYWKPIQAGELDYTDTMRVKEWVTHPKARFYPESYRLTQPMSPHAAAKIDKIQIDLNHIQLPKTEDPLVVEGAGGLMVPLNDKELILDLIEHLGLPVVLVSQKPFLSFNRFNGGPPTDQLDIKH